MAISFVDYEAMSHFETIEKRASIKLERERIDGFDLPGERPKKTKGPPPTKGKRPSKKDKLRAKAKAERSREG